uniref:Secreted RxLR effector protein 82 n=1 Tax=Plasmopara viticola TaxID=143451 RepID=RLR82_PLAVT|nr:RecName: Full=Secreted RxLR effector protein 82; Flags: Precursor [Plasmopara viticola]
MFHLYLLLVFETRYTCLMKCSISTCSYRWLRRREWFCLIYSGCCRKILVIEGLQRSDVAFLFTRRTIMHYVPFRGLFCASCVGYFSIRCCSRCEHFCTKTPTKSFGTEAWS